MDEGPPGERHLDRDAIRRPRARLIVWLRALREVLRDPSHPIPCLSIPPEGRPLPMGLGLYCLKCGYDLSGLAEWRCPECGERFNPYRVHTQMMRREPEYFLRYRYGPGDLRTMFQAVLLLLAGALILMLGGQPAFCLSMFAVPALLGLLVWLVLQGMVAEIPWIRLAHWVSLVWFLFCVAIVAASRIFE